MPTRRTKVLALSALALMPRSCGSHLKSTFSKSVRFAGSANLALPTASAKATFPVEQSLLRHNGSVWLDWSVLKSTATDIGEITLPTLMLEEEQLAEVKRRALEYIASLPVDDEGRKVLLKGGGSAAEATLIEGREVEYNREEILIGPDGSLTVSAVLHRPLRASTPWSFGFPGVCPTSVQPGWPSTPRAFALR